MVTNPFFNNTSQTSEQDLFNDLIVESIQIKGVDVHYLPRTNVNVSDLYTEEQIARFDTSFVIEMFIENASGFGGDKEFLSVFGTEIADRLTFSLAISRFKEEIGDVLGYQRPHEGDVIYLPMTGSLYEIKFVEPEIYFYQLGKLYTYNLVCETFIYNNEEFNTGIPAVDQIQDNYSTDIQISYILGEDGTPMLDEYGKNILDEDHPLEEQDVQAQNDFLGDAALDILDFSISSPFSESGR